MKDKNISKIPNDVWFLIRVRILGTELALGEYTFFSEMDKKKTVSKDI